MGRGEDDLEHRLRDLAPPGSVVEVTVFASGALDVLVRIPNGPVVVMQGAADRSEYGLTPDLRHANAGFDDGHHLLFDNYEAAVDALVELIVPRV